MTHTHICIFKLIGALHIITTLSGVNGGDDVGIQSARRVEGTEGGGLNS